MTLSAPIMTQQDKQIQQTVEQERKRLLDFIRRRVPTTEDAEDILQDVFFQFTNTVRMMEPIERTASWLYTVARNKITDFFRKKKSIPFSHMESGYQDEEGDDSLSFIDEIMSDASDSPEAEYMRSLVWDTLNAALDELPAEQREVFVLHELDGKSFEEIQQKIKVPVNTLLSRKRYAVLHLRERLQSLYEELLTK